MKDFGVGQVVSTAIAAGSAIRGYFPGRDPPMSSQISSALRDATDMVRAVNSTFTTVTGKRNAQQDVQYIAAVRNSRSKYGKKRRKNLRNAWYELNKGTEKIWSRFQTFRDNGFADAIGPVPCTLTQQTGGNLRLPFYAFRLSSLPCGYTALQTNTQLTPIVGYQLVREPPPVPPATGDRVYKWQRLDNSVLTNKGFTDSTLVNMYDVYESRGTSEYPVGASGAKNQNVPDCVGFRHEWSDIRMTMYPQTKLPTDWTVRLVKWKDDLPTYPPSEGWTANGTATTVYSHTYAASGQRAADVTTMWDSYFGGKFLHPNNINNSVQTDYGKLPFVLLRTEKFYVPSREQTTADAPARLLHKFFFRNDRQYNSTLNTQTIIENPATVASYNYIDSNKVSSAAVADEKPWQSSPFTTPGDEVWLVIEAKSFKEFRDQAYPKVDAEVPTFDLMIRNCHSYRPGDVSSHIYQAPGPARLLDDIPEEPLPEEPPSEETPTEGV